MDDLELTWGSCCSGSEGVHYVVEACAQAMEETGLPVTFQHAFSCESNKAKRSWIADVLCKGQVFNSDMHETFATHAEVGCIFEDIKDMGSEMSKCSLHGKECPVPSVDCLFIGTSCKDLSRANSSVDKSKLWFCRRKAAEEPLRKPFEACSVIARVTDRRWFCLKTWTQ